MRRFSYLRVSIFVHYDWPGFRDLIYLMASISKAEFEKIVNGIVADRETIIKHNPIGTPEETLLWMLLSCLVTFLSLSEMETPCFTGMPDANTYREAILFILRDRKTEDFSAEKYLELITTEVTESAKKN